MHKHSDFNGFDEIKASDELKMRLYRETRKRLSNRYKKPHNYKIAAIALCVTCCIAVIAIINPGSNHNTLIDTPTSISSTNPIEPANSTTPTPLLNAFTLMVSASGSGTTPREITLDGVDMIIPSTGPDFSTEIIDGKEIEILNGWACPDLQVDGDDILSVTYTVQNEMLFYEDSRNWKTDEGFPTWTGYNFIIPKDGYADPNEPTLEEVIEQLEILREREELYGLEQKILQHEYAVNFYEEHGRLPTDDEYSTFFNTMRESFVSEPLDYSRFDITWFKDFGEFIVTISNPQNPSRGTQMEKQLTVRPGEIVTWYYSNETVEKMNGHTKGEFDFTQLKDTMEVEIKFKSGESKAVTLLFSHDKNGIIHINGNEKI